MGSPICTDEGVRYDYALASCRDCVAELLNTAETTGVDLCIENVWNGLFYSPCELADIIDSFKSSRLGVYLDVGNLIGYHQYPPHWIELLEARINRVHVKDFRHEFGWSGTYSFCDLQDGDVPWEDTFSALRGVSYNGTVIAEMMPYSPGLLSRTSKAMDRLLAAGTPSNRSVGDTT